MATISAREFNHDVSGAKRLAAVETVIITDRGEPSFALLSIAQYRRLSGASAPLSELLNDEDSLSTEADFSRVDDAVRDVQL